MVETGTPVSLAQVLFLRLRQGYHQREKDSPEFSKYYWEVICNKLYHLVVALPPQKK